MNHEVTRLLTRRLEVEEPAFTLDPGEAIAGGHKMRARRRRHVAIAVAGAFVVSFGVAGTVTALDRGRSPDFASSRVPSDFDAENMPHVLEQVAREAFGPRLDNLKQEFSAKRDDGTTVLTAGEYDQASSMQLSYSDGADHFLSIYVAHARSEAEGSPEEGCDSLRAAWQASVPECNVTRIEGFPVTTSVTIGSPMTTNPGDRVWEMLPLASADAVAAQGRNLYFTQSVKVVRTDTLVTSVREVVRARTLNEAKQLFRWAAETLTEVAADPRLAIPPPV